MQADNSFICQGLQEERFRAERLEEQVNDLTELHQAETGNLKQALADAEEKLSYQSEERLRDLAEMLEACQTKVFLFCIMHDEDIRTARNTCGFNFRYLDWNSSSNNWSLLKG